MSSINEKNHLGVALDSLSKSVMDIPGEALELEMKKILNKGVHGMSFSPYVEGQAPAIQSKISREQIETRMKVIQPYTSWVRSFSCADGNELIPEVAHAMGLKTMVGAWIAGDKERNQIELDSLITLAKNGYADIIAVGNEIILRGELTEDEIIDYINQVKEAVPGVPVGYVDAYYIFSDYPRIAEACDVILANCYPYWENCPLTYAVDYMSQMYEKALASANGKPIIITETGWPNKGTDEGGAQPSYENAMSYFVNTYRWSQSQNVEVFYFSSFDEAWKIHHEGECGAYWGIWDKDNNYKYTKHTGE